MDDQAKALYRHALGAFPTGVAVVTVDDRAGGAAALTVNSFSSISLDPPLIGWSLGSASDRGVWFREVERFTINILAAEDAGLAADHARRGNYRLEPERTAPGDPPAVTGALTRLYCRVVERIPLGDHVLFVGEVTSFDTREGDSLTYFRGRYGRATSAEKAP